MTQPTSPETPTETLARSIFGFAVIALLAAIITWVWLLFAPASVDATYRMIQLGILGGFGVFVLFLVWITRTFYKTDPQSLESASEIVVKFLGKPFPALVFITLVIELNILIFLVLQGIAASITNPFKFLMVCWSVLLIGIVVTINQVSIQKWYAQSQAVWTSIGLLITGIVIFLILLVVNGWLIGASGLNDSLRGGLDFRALRFYDDGSPLPSAQDYWIEQSQTRVRWSPYTYWVLDSFDGEYINISAEGIRYTPDYGGTQDIFVFGGSTVWGEGARDAYTIPGHLARLLNEAENPQIVRNYGQTGYVSSQDNIWFQRQLLRDNTPDIAIFYQGFNDTLAAWGSGYTGVSLQENMRLNDAEAGRRLRAGQPILNLPNISLSTYDMSAAAIDETTAESIADHWFAQVEQVQAVADAYNVETLFVWQPAIFYKVSLTDSEASLYQLTQENRPGLFDLYQEVDTIVRQRVQEQGFDHIIILSDLFADNDDEIFHDLVHINEIGNAIVAEAILPYLGNLLED